MATMSNYNRYQGETIRICGFGSDKMVIDNMALNSGLVSINSKPIDIKGFQHEISCSNCWNLWRKSGKNNYWYNYAYENILPDISSEVSSFGEPQFIDPNEGGVSYLLTQRATSSTVVLHKLDKDGNVLQQNDTLTLYLPVFIDSDETHIGVLGYDTASYYPSVTYFKKDTLAKDYTYYPTSDSYNSIAQVVYRDNDVISMISFSSSVPSYYNRGDKTTSNRWVKYTLESGSQDFEVVGYSTGLVTNLSKTMGNGWNYKLANATSGVGQPIKFQAMKMNHSAKTYATVLKDAMTIEWADKCDVRLKNLLQPETYYYKSVRYELHKLSEDTLILIMMIDPDNRDINTLTDARSAYWVIKIAPDDHTKLTVANAQYFDYLYVSRPIVFNKDKILCFQQEIAAHSYKLNPVTYDLELVWNIPTPNLYSAGFYNGYLWWINGVTNELNYEIESNILRAVDNYSQLSVDLENEESPKEINYMLSIYDIDNNRVAKDVKLTMTTDAMVFKDNSSKVLTTKTLTSGDLVVPVKCIKASKGARIAITLLNN